MASGERLGVLPPPVPRCSRHQNEGETRVLKLIRGGEWKAALESIGNGSDSESTWRRWRVLTNERRQVQASYISSRSWPIAKQANGFSQSDSSLLPPLSQHGDLHGRILEEIHAIQTSAVMGSVQRQSVKRKERFAYPHITEMNEKQKASSKRAEHAHEWKDVKVRCESSRDFRLPSPNEEDRSRSKSSFSLLPRVGNDTFHGSKFTLNQGPSFQRLPHFDTLGIKVLNSPGYPAIKSYLEKCNSIFDKEAAKRPLDIQAWESSPSNPDEFTQQLLDSFRKEADFSRSYKAKQDTRSSVSRARIDAVLDANKWMESLIRDGASKVLQGYARALNQRSLEMKHSGSSSPSPQTERECKDTDQPRNESGTEIRPRSSSTYEEDKSCVPSAGHQIESPHRNDNSFVTARRSEIESAYEFWVTRRPEVGAAHVRPEACLRRASNLQKVLQRRAPDIARFKTKDKRWITDSVRNDEIGLELGRVADETRNVYKRISDLYKAAAEVALKRAKRDSQIVDQLNAEAKVASEVAERVTRDSERHLASAKQSAETGRLLREQVKPASIELNTLQERYVKAERENEKARRDLSKAEAAVLAAQFHGSVPGKGHHHHAMVLKKTYEEGVENVRIMHKELQALQQRVADKEAEASAAELKAKNDLIYANEMKRKSEEERKHADELLAKVAKTVEELQRTEENLRLRMIAAHAALEEQKKKERSSSELFVLDRLRAKSLGSIQDIQAGECKDLTKDVVLKEPVYVGQRKSGQRNGLGVLEFEQGVEYCGLWMNDVPSGAGVERYADGSFYAGFFDSGLRHGLGTYMLTGGLAFLGAWASGQRVGSGVVAIAAKSESQQHIFYPLALISITGGIPSEIKDFKTDVLEHCALMADVQLATQEAWATANKARAMGFEHYFGTCEKEQEQRIVNMGLTLLTERKAPMVVAFEGMDRQGKARMKLLQKARIL